MAAADALEGPAVDAGVGGGYLCAPVPLVPSLNYLPAGSVLMSYGGGDAMAMARQLAFATLQPTEPPVGLRTRVAAAARAALAAPAHDFMTLDRGALGVGHDEPNWRVRLQLSSHVYGAGECL